MCILCFDPLKMISLLSSTNLFLTELFTAGFFLFYHHKVAIVKLTIIESFQQKTHQFNRIFKSFSFTALIYFNIDKIALIILNLKTKKNQFVVFFQFVVFCQFVAEFLVIEYFDKSLKQSL